MTKHYNDPLSYAFSLRSPNRVYCPACGVLLTQRTFAIARDMLWCLRCSDAKYYRESWIQCAILWWSETRGWDTAHGVRIWMIDEPRDGLVTLYVEQRRRPGPPITDAEAIGLLAENDAKITT